MFCRGSVAKSAGPEAVQQQKKRGKNERRLSAEKGSPTAATMETRRGAKAPLVSLLSQAFARSHPM